jgi:hypothetical protein
MGKEVGLPIHSKLDETTLDLGVEDLMNKQRTQRKETTLNIGQLKFSISHSDLMHDQGVTIRIYGPIENVEKQILRFDCFDQAPHYHYDPDGRNEMHDIDLTTAGNPLGFVLTNIRLSLATLLDNAGASKLAENLSIPDLSKGMDEVEIIAREMAIKSRKTVTHNRGNLVIEAGNIRFGLEYRNLSSDRGMAIHVLGDVAGQEVEILAFDCFEKNPHYHYGPRNKNIRIYWDRTMFPDTLDWTFRQFKSRKLSTMIQRAGYPGIANELDDELIATKLPDIEKQAWIMVRSMQVD